MLWCESARCRQRIAPTYRRLAEEYAGTDAVIVASLDGDQHAVLAEKLGVTAFPIIKWFGRVRAVAAPGAWLAMPPR